MKINARLVGVILREEVIGESGEVENYLHYLSKESPGLTVDIRAKTECLFSAQLVQFTCEERFVLLDGPDKDKHVVSSVKTYMEGKENVGENDEERKRVEMEVKGRK